jgi:hypothetical protein
MPTLRRCLGDHVPQRAWWKRTSRNLQRRACQSAHSRSLGQQRRCRVLLTLRRNSPRPRPPTRPGSFTSNVGQRGASGAYPLPVRPLAAGGAAVAGLGAAGEERVAASHAAAPVAAPRLAMPVPVDLNEVPDRQIQYHLAALLRLVRYGRMFTRGKQTKSRSATHSRALHGLRLSGSTYRVRRYFRPVRPRSPPSPTHRHLDVLIARSGPHSPWANVANPRRRAWPRRF